MGLYNQETILSDLRATRAVVNYVMDNIDKAWGLDGEKFTQTLAAKNHKGAVSHNTGNIITSGGPRK